MGWWWIINNAAWRKGSILPPLDSQNSCTLFSAVLFVLVDFILEERWELTLCWESRGSNSFDFELLLTLWGLWVFWQSVLCSLPSVPCLNLLPDPVHCSFCFCVTWALLAQATDSHSKWVHLKGLFIRWSTKVTSVTLALLTNEVWARKSGWFRHVLQYILPGHPLYMPTTDKSFVLMFKGGGEDRFSLENSKCCWRQTQFPPNSWHRGCLSVCVDGLAAGVVHTSCYVGVTAVQLSLLRRMWALFPLALSGIVFFSSPPPPVPVKWDFEIFLWKGLTRGVRLSCCQQRLMS